VLTVQLLTGAAAIATAQAKAAEKPRPANAGEIQISSTIALVSDYRRGGVSRSGGNPAVQASLDIDTPSGWSTGIWASTIKRKGAHVEVDLYGSRTFELGETDLTLGATAITFPGADDFDFVIAQATVSRDIGPIDAAFVVTYAPEQGNIDDEDGFGVSLRGRTPIGRFAGAPITLGASAGYVEGHFALDEESKFDWSISLATEISGVDISFSYTDTDIEDDERAEEGLMLSIARSF
jgi:uncharacterized protein (TIGR02001 family)